MLFVVTGADGSGVIPECGFKSRPFHCMWTIAIYASLCVNDSDKLVPKQDFEWALGFLGELIFSLNFLDVI